MNNRDNVAPQRFYALDAARGFSAVAIVMWHWKYFFYDGTNPGNFDTAAQPFYPIIFAFYEKGYLAVDFFFCLSGFVFFWLYGGRIGRGEVGLRSFFWLRFSKLYPLHFATLMAVLLGQRLMLGQTGCFFVYPGNDVYHFVLNLSLTTAWGLQREFSYNYPVWWVSVAVLLYSLFFLICRQGLFRWCWLIVGLLVVLVMNGRNSDFGRGLFSFFAGGFAYYVFSRLLAEGRCERWRNPLIVATVSGFLLAALNAKLDFIGPAVSRLIGYAEIPVIGDRFVWLLVTGWLFPLTLLTLVVAETSRGALGKGMAYLGDISYSIYLLHFPLQLFYAYVLTSAGLPKSFYYTELSAFFFLALLLGLSMASHRYLECPARQFLRDRFLRAP